MPVRSHTAKSALTAVLFTTLSGPALADLTVCNQTREPAGVALAAKAGAIWRSDGWWTIEPGRCKSLLKGRLTNQDYYLHALHYNVGGRWDGEERFCVDRGSFSIEGRLDCEQRGYETAGFLKIDPQGKSDWQHTLADNHQTSSHGRVIDHSKMPKGMNPEKPQKSPPEDGEE